jgi:hypothetical protein
LRDRRQSWYPTSSISTTTIAPFTTSRRSYRRAKSAVFAEAVASRNIEIAARHARTSNSQRVPREGQESAHRPAAARPERGGCNGALAGARALKE